MKNLGVKREVNLQNKHFIIECLDQSVECLLCVNIVRIVFVFSSLPFCLFLYVSISMIYNERLKNKKMQ